MQITSKSWHLAKITVFTATAKHHGCCDFREFLIFCCLYWSDLLLAL